MRIQRPAPQTSSFRILVGALLLGGILVASALFRGAGTTAEPGTVLDAGAPGEVRATYLDDGSPVFVVHSVDGMTHVVSAVGPRAQGLVTWCGDTRTFVETGGTSRWDEQGRYLFGPADAGLALHTVVADPNGATVQVGPRLRPRPLSDDPQPVFEEGSCYVGGGAGGLRHDRGDITRQPVESITGTNFAMVTAWLTVGPDRIARLCPARRCSRQSREVTGTFHDAVSLDEYVGRASGEFLVRLTPQGTFDDLVDLDRAVDKLRFVGKPTPYSPADVTAELVEVITRPGPRLVMARPADPRPVYPDGPSAAPPRSRTWRLAEDARIVSLTTQGQYPYADFLTIAELQKLVAAEGPLPVEIHLDGQGVAVALRPVASAQP